MNTSGIASRVHYERLKNGVDMYLLKTPVTDVVTCKIALPGGVYSTFDRQTIAALLTDLLPGGTKKQARSTVLERIEALGGSVAVQVVSGHTIVSVGSRKSVFDKVLEVVLETLTQPQWRATEFKEAQMRVAQALVHAEEDTELQAGIVAHQALYKKGHPHWKQGTRSVAKELEQVTQQDVRKHWSSALTGVGATVCVVGDINVRALTPKLRTILSVLPGTPPKQPTVHPARTQAPKKKDIILTMPEKYNIDTLMVLPLALTKESGDFHALGLGTAVLGGSSSSRLFNILRTRESLTYGSVASLQGFQDGYPGFLSVWAIFPHDLFSKGRKVLQHIVHDFCDAGVTAKELAREKEAITGKFKVGLATTRGVCDALLGTILAGRPLSFIDEYPALMNGLTRSEVNNAIKEHMHYELAVTAAAGAIDADGTAHPRT